MRSVNRPSGGVVSGRQGQSYTEYIIVTSVLLLALTSGNPSPITQLYNQLRDNYKGYGFAVTRPVIKSNDVVQTVKTEVENVRSQCTGNIQPMDCVKNLAQFADDRLPDDVLPDKEKVKDVLLENATEMLFDMLWPPF